MIENLGAPLWLTIGVLAGFLLDWLAIALSWLKLKPFTKLLAMLLVIFWTFTAFGFEMNLAVGLLISAQCFGLLGDLFLLFPNRWFLGGLVAFLLGHFLYIGLIVMLLVEGFAIGLLTTITGLMPLILITLWIIFMAFFYRVFTPHIRSGNANSIFWIAVLFYAFILSGLMLLSVLFIILLPGYAAPWLFLPLGGILFLVSDFLLAYDRFVKRINLGQLWVRITYHLAQFSLAIGFILLIENVVKIP
jgi:uncharacterized membrane protein YhhN